jgi:hypothetical protein
VLAAVDQSLARADDEVADGAADEYLARAGETAESISDGLIEPNIT